MQTAQWATGGPGARGEGRPMAEVVVAAIHDGGSDTKLTGGWVAALCSMRARRQYGACRLANGSRQRRAAEVCRAADRGAGGKAVRDTSVNWRAALGVGKRLKNVAKRHCARCERACSTEHAVWLTALPKGGRLGWRQVGPDKPVESGSMYRQAGCKWTACDGGLNKGNTQQDMGKD